MEKLKKNYDRVLLVVIGLITLVASVMLIMKASAVGQKFPGVDVGNGEKYDAPPVDKVIGASKHVETPINWKTPIAEGSEKVYRLFASIPIVWKEGVEEPIDLFNESTPLREGISNKYLMDHNLPYRRNDVLDLDLDGDGFSNAEEFALGGTDPRNKDDYPDPTHKLQLTNISTQPYIVMFASQAGGKDFSVRRMDPPGARLLREEKWPTTWAKLGDSFPASGDDLNRFKALNFEEKDVHMAASSLNKSNVGVLTVEDSTSGKKIELIQKVKTDIPIYRASFFYNGPGGPAEFKELEKGDTFKLSGTDIDIKITNVTENEAEFEASAAGKAPKTLKRSL